jgi:hypothetical protein
MAEHKLLPKSNAVVLSSSHKSRPFWEGRTPRWICQVMMERACVPVTGGIYRLNKVSEPFIPIQVSTGVPLTNLPSQNLSITNSHNEGTTLNSSYAAYDEAPREIHLQPIQTVVKMHTRIPALYSTHHNQLEMQLSLAAEWMYETKENLIFNHPDYGLLNNVAPRLHMKTEGPPTPDLLDDMLSHAWKNPDIFMAHPEAIAVFTAQCNKAGITLNTTEFHGGKFVTWRGLPIFPTNKLYLLDGEGQKLVDRQVGKSRTSFLLMRLGEDKQGVISLYAAGTEGSPRFPFITVDFMGISDESEASYLMTLYAAMAVLTFGALCQAEVVI